MSKFCTSCGTENDDNAKFCTGCGARLGSDDDEYMTGEIFPDSSSGYQEQNQETGDWNSQYDNQNQYGTQDQYGGPDQYGGNYQYNTGDQYEQNKKTKKNLLIAGIIIVSVLLCFGGWYYYTHYMNTGTATGQSMTSASNGKGSAGKDSANNNSSSGSSNSSSGNNSSSSGSSSANKKHSYQIVMKDVTWDEANKLAGQAGGYLLHIDSDAEFAQIQQMINNQNESNGKFFIGGCRSSGSNDYYWVDSSSKKTGSPLNSSQYWLSGDPSYSDTDKNGNTVTEDKMAIFYYDSGGYWVWADVPNDITSTAPEYSGKIGYIIETES